MSTPHIRLLTVVGGDYDIDYSGFSIRGDQDIDTKTVEEDSTSVDRSGTRNRDSWNDVTYAEYSKITTLQTRKWIREPAHLRAVCVSQAGNSPSSLSSLV